MSEQSNKLEKIRYTHFSKKFLEPYEIEALGLSEYLGDPNTQVIGIYEREDCPPGGYLIIKFDPSRKLLYFVKHSTPENFTLSEALDIAYKLLPEDFIGLTIPCLNDIEMVSYYTSRGFVITKIFSSWKFEMTKFFDGKSRGTEGLVEFPLEKYGHRYESISKKVGLNTGYIARFTIKNEMPYISIYKSIGLTEQESKGETTEQ